jgi:peptide/nickel transport system ATP-binding protein
MIAMALANKPDLLIADEPTTAVDVTTQARILDLLRRLVAEDDVGLILISHDLAVVADMADRIAIMRDGEVVEQGETIGLFRGLRHPYSRMLFAASTYSSTRERRLRPEEGHRAPILDVSGVVLEYRLPRRTLFDRPRHLRAVDDVGFTIRRGENLGLVGESGSGKSTLARVILALLRPRAGAVILDGADFLASRGEGRRALRRHIQAVFQDPYGSLDPRYRVAHLIAEPFHLDRSKPSTAERRKRVDEALTAVGLTPADGDKYPHEFSGGERQRLAIARALITRPSLIILDEAVSALDVSIRAQILDLLADLGDQFSASYLFISHDLTVVRAITDRVVIMREGRIVEQGETERVFASPQHPYTAELIAATPDLERALAARQRRTSTT